MTDDEREFVEPRIVASVIQGSRETYNIKSGVRLINRKGTVQTGFTTIGGKTPIGEYSTYDEEAGELTIDIDGITQEVNERMSKRFES